MNPEIKTLMIKFGIMALTALATKLHLDPSLSSYYPAIAADVADLALLAYTVYLNRGMKKVPVEAHATVAGVTVSKPGETKVKTKSDIAGKIGTGLLAFFILMSAQDARAQIKFQKGPVATAIENKVEGKTGNISENVLAKIDAVAIVDAKYALKLATAQNSPLLIDCLTAIVARIEARQAAVADADVPPEPALMTKATKLILLHDALAADSPLMRACSPLAFKIGRDARAMIGDFATGALTMAAF